VKKHVGEFKVDFVCCFCGRTVHAGYSNSEPILLHEAPPCDEYVKMDMLDFMQACRKAAEAKASN